MLFKERLRAARVRLGKTQQSVADAIGIHVVTYAKWEAGRAPRTPALVSKSAEVLGVSLEWLMSGVGRMVRRKRHVSM